MADPRTDEMVTSFGDNFAVVQFPFVAMDKGIVFNALRQSRFNDAIDAFMSGFEKSTGITIEDNQQLAHVIGGSIKSIGIKRSELSTNKNKNAKTKKGSS